MAEVIKQATTERRAMERKRDFQEVALSVMAEESQYRALTDIAKKERCDLGAYLMEVARVFTSSEEYEGDERLLRHALHHEAPLHIRRTLDQSYYCTLEDTSERDRDQVIYRATKGSNKKARIVMVDQLWMWILDESELIHFYRNSSVYFRLGSRQLKDANVVSRDAYGADMHTRHHYHKFSATMAQE
jgi:hypothetical protein